MSLREALARHVPGLQRREFVLFGASTLVYQGGRFVFSLAAAAALAQADFSTWAIVLSILVYAPSLLLGVTNGMSRELPILGGSGDDRAAHAAEGAAWVATVIAAIAAVGLSVLATLVVTADTSSLVLVGLVAAGAVVYFTILSVHRSRLRFDAASAQQATFGVAVVVFAIVLAIGGTADLNRVIVFYGLCLGLSIVVGLVLARPSRPRADAGELRRLSSIGFPIMLAGLVFSLYVTLDRWIAVLIVGTEEAAPYALASLIAAATLVIPSVVSQQIYPRMGIARGAGASVDELRGMARDQGMLAGALIVPVVLIIVLFAWFGIPVVLTEYEGSVSSIVILSLGLLALSLLNGYGNYLNVVGGQWRYLGAQVIGLVTAVSLMLIAGTLLGLVGIAIGMSLSHVVYGLVLREVAMRTGISASQVVETPAVLA